MKNIYNVTGMTCNGCRSSVEDILNQLPGVSKAAVNLETSEAIIETDKTIAVKTLQEALPDKYRISEKKTNTTVILQKANNDLKQLFPLFLIFGYITITALWLNITPWDGSGFMLDFMGLFYIVFSFFKFLDLKGFPESFKMYDPLAKVNPIYAWLYPFIETALGILFLKRIAVPILLIVTLIILGVTTIGVIGVLRNKRTIQCACLGTTLKLPMTKATFIENSIMIIMAIIMLFS